MVEFAGESATRIKLIKIWEMLVEHSGEKNKLSTAEMLSMLKKEGIPCDRRTLYADIRLLKENGFGVVVERGRENYYYVSERKLTKKDVVAAVDSLKQNENVSVSETRNVVKELLKLCYNGGADMPEHKAIFVNKTFSTDVYQIVEKFDAAVAEKKRVSFTAFDVGVDKDRINEKKYSLVTPIAAVIYEKKYYLCFYDKGSFHAARADRVEDVKISLKEVERVNLSENSINSRVAESVCGSVVKVTFMAENTAAGEVFDRFGELVTPYKQGAEMFSFTVPVAVNERLFGWCFSLGGTVRINAPLAVKKQYEEFLTSVFKKTIR